MSYAPQRSAPAGVTLVRSFTVYQGGPARTVRPWAGRGSLRHKRHSSVPCPACRPARRPARQPYASQSGMPTPEGHRVGDGVDPHFRVPIETAPVRRNIATTPHWPGVQRVQRGQLPHSGRLSASASPSLPAGTRMGAAGSGGWARMGGGLANTMVYFLPFPSRARGTELQSLQDQQYRTLQKDAWI